MFGRAGDGIGMGNRDQVTILGGINWKQDKQVAHQHGGKVEAWTMPSCVLWSMFGWDHQCLLLMSYLCSVRVVRSQGFDDLVVTSVAKRIQH